MLQRTVFLTVAAFSMLALLAAGCSSAPRGAAGGRVDPYATTRADERSTEASVPALLEFSDITAQRLAQDLTSLPAVQRADRRLVLELGTIQNRTRTASSDFEMMQRRLRSSLLRSRLITDHFMIVEGRQRMEGELQRIQGQPQDLLQEGLDNGGVAQFDPRDIYVLQGDFYESVRGTTRRYYFNFKLTHLATREIVFDNDFDLGQETRR